MLAFMQPKLCIKINPGFHQYHKLRCTSRPSKPEKITTKLGVDLYKRVKIQIITA